MNKDLIYKRRTELGLTQQQVADACGVSKATVSQWESGQITNMKHNRIAKLSVVLQLSPLELMGFSSSKDLAILDDEIELILAFRKQPAAVQDAIKRMLGL